MEEKEIIEVATRLLGDAAICLTIIWSVQYLMIITPDEHSIIPVIAQNPAYLDRMTCSQFKPLIEQAQSCFNVSLYPQVQCSLSQKSLILGGMNRSG